MAKKSSKKTRKKTASAAKKTSRKKPAAKKKTKKKSSKKKAATRKAPTKKAATKKPATSKKSPSKSSAKASGDAKASGKSKRSRADASGKKNSGSKTSTKPASSSKSSRKSGASDNGDSTSKDPAQRFRSHFSGDRDTSRAAAAKLAEAAGLTSIRSAAAAVQESKKKYRRLSKSPFNAEQLQEFRQILLEKRAQLVGDVTSMESEALGGGDGGSLSHLPQHMADQGSDTFEQSLNLDLAASQRGLLKEIDGALERIANNTYGICELLGKPIKVERLRHTPWARFSIEAARQLELNPHLAESLGE